MRRRKVVWFAALLAGISVSGYFALPYLMRTGADAAPLNFVAASDAIHTSGQPSAAQLRRLRARGYSAVINLAPSGSYGSIADEAAILADAGLAYVQIPVDWSNPTAADFARFIDALRAQRGGKVLVHCQMNLRASTFVFLSRVVHDGAEMEVAFDNVHAVWTPNETWTQVYSKHARSACCGAAVLIGPSADDARG
jgi:protein tyrosine phosphatase (PTP) superfamily phosphohydrolase (DUF442 family)